MLEEEELGDEGGGGLVGAEVLDGERGAVLGEEAAVGVALEVGGKEWLMTVHQVEPGGR